nr:NADH dehydrogenase subunit 2 [Phlyctenosis sp. N135]
MMKFYKMIFLLTLVLGSLIAMSSYSWMSMWIGLEINLLSIIPLLSSSESLYPSESALKYFITQAMASAVLLFSIASSMNLCDYITQVFEYPLMMMMNSAVLTKMGAAPFHAWFPEVMEGLSWANCLVMLTWQKLAPMVILMYNTSMVTFLSIIIVLSTVISGVLGLNQVSLRKIMAYSSINHISWMVGSMLYSQPVWLVYFITYSVISINLVMLFLITKSYHLKQLFCSMNSNKTMKFMFMMNFLSLGGLPPFLGFLPKWLTINGLVNNNFIVVSITLIISTLVTLFFYLRVMFSTLVINSKETIIYQTTTKMFSITILTFLSLSGLIACALLPEMT